MITKDDLIYIGTIGRAYGKNGANLMRVDAEWIYDVEEEGLHFVFAEKDGCYVPFRVESISTPGSKTIIKMQCSKSIEDAEKLERTELYVAKKDAEGYAYKTEEDLVGYALEDENGNCVGEIVCMDGSTANTLLYVESEEDGEELMIPAADDLVIEINDEERVVRMRIPEGLLDINKGGVSEEEYDND